MNCATLESGDNMKIQHTQHLNSVESTNTYLKTIDNSEKPDGLLVYTYNQTKGRGRRASTWNSQKNKDIALSIYHQAAQESFVNLMQATVSVVDTLHGLNIDATIKLPNDIYVNNQKIAGILIENTIQSSIASTVIGIGINVNSTRIENDNEISIKDILATPIDKEHFKKRFIDSYNRIDERTLYDTFKSYINFKNHICTYDGTHYNLIDIKDDFICVLEKNNSLIKTPCQNVGFKIKNR